MATPKYVFMFGTHPTNSKEILGGKGAGLAQMKKMGLPVPNGFTITTEACGERWPEGLKEEIAQRLVELEHITGKSFGSGPNPLLVSVRSGAAVSMPGLMPFPLRTVMNFSFRHDGHCSEPWFER